MDEHKLLIEGVPEREGIIQRRDPRARVVAGAVLSVTAVVLHDPVLLAANLSVAIVLCVAARVPLTIWFHRIVGLNILLGMLVFILPFSVEGRPLALVMGRPWTYEGLIRAVQIILRANGIVLALTALLGMMQPVTFGHALQDLRVPQKLIQLFLFTVRYAGVFEQEYLQLRLAMRLRAFEPRLNLHTLRTYGNLIGMLLVRAIDRANAIHDAMKCRGFTGRFACMHEFRFRAADAAFLAGIVAAGALLSGWQLA